MTGIIPQSNRALKAGKGAAALNGAADAVPLYSWYVLFIMALTYGLASIDRGVVPVIVEEIRKEFDLRDTQLGFLSGMAFGLTYTLCAIPAGLLIDRINRKNLLAAGAGVWSVMTVLGGFAQSYAHLVVVRMAVGMAESTVSSTLSIITDYFPERRRPMAMGLYSSGAYFGIGICFALGGWVAHEWGWRSAFLIVGLPGLVMSGLIILTVREPVRGAVERRIGASPQSAPPLLDTLRYLLSTPSAVHILTGYMITGATISSFWAWIAPLLIRIHGLNIQEAGLLVALSVGLFGGIGSLLGAYISDRLGRRGLKPVLYFLAMAAALAAPMGIAMSLVSSLWLASVFMIAVSMVLSSLTGPAQGILLSVAKVRMRGVTAVLINAFGALVSYSLGPLLAGALSEALGGGTSVRYGLALLFLFDVWAAFHYWRASRTLVGDLDAATR